MPRLLLALLLSLSCLSLLAEPNSDLQAALEARDPVAIQQALQTGAQPNQVRPYAAGLAIRELAIATDKEPWRDLLRDLARRGHFPVFERGYPFPYRGSIVAMTRDAPAEMPLVLELLGEQSEEDQCTVFMGVMQELSLDPRDRGGRLVEWVRLAPVAALVPADQRQNCALDHMLGRIITAHDREMLLLLLQMGYPIRPYNAQNFLITQSMYKPFDRAFFDQLLPLLDLYANPNQGDFAHTDTRWTSLLEGMLSSALATESRLQQPEYPWFDWNNYLAANVPDYWHQAPLESRCLLGRTLANFWWYPHRSDDSETHPHYETRQNLASMLALDYLSVCPLGEDSGFNSPDILTNMLSSGESELVALALSQGLKPKLDEDTRSRLLRAAVCSNSLGVLNALAADEALLEGFLHCIPVPEQQDLSQQHLDTLAWLLSREDANAPLPFSGATPLVAAEQLGNAPLLAALHAAGATAGEATDTQRIYWRNQRLVRVVQAYPADVYDPGSSSPEEFNFLVEALPDLGTVLAPHYQLRNCSSTYCGTTLLGRNSNGHYQVLLQTDRVNAEFGERYMGLSDVSFLYGYPVPLYPEDDEDGATEPFEQPDVMQDFFEPTTWRFNGKSYQPLLCEHTRQNTVSGFVKQAIVPCP